MDGINMQRRLFQFFFHIVLKSGRLTRELGMYEDEVHKKVLMD
jgi:hypothetical protein